MPKVLLIAYACEPGRGSEWGTSWAFVSEMARHQPVWMIAHADNRERLDAHLATQPTPHPIHVTYVALPRRLAWLRNSIYALHNVHYYLWQFAAAKAARTLHEQVGFDVCQHVSYSRWWMPSAGATLAPRGVKFIFGPCVGGELMPPSFGANVPFRAKLGEFQRWIARTIWSNDPTLARCIRSADIVVAGTPASVQGVARFGPRRIEVLPSVMITDTTLIDATRPLRAAFLADRPADDVFRICSVGGMVYYRGVDLILRAIKQSGIERFEYVHCCGGDMLEPMKRLAAELGLADRVRFTGETRHPENLRCAAGSDVLAHVVLRDSQGVVPEALALGVPVLALDHHSMSPIIDETVGHKVPMHVGTTPQDVIDDVARQLRTWYDDRGLLRRMSEACVARSRELSPAYRVSLIRKWHAELMQAETDTSRSAAKQAIADPSQ